MNAFTIMKAMIGCGTPYAKQASQMYGEYGKIAAAPLAAGGNRNFLASKPAVPASIAFPKGMKIFPIFIVETIRLNAPVTAPARGPIDMVSNREGKTDK